MKVVVINDMKPELKNTNTIEAIIIVKKLIPIDDLIGKKGRVKL